MSWHDKHGSHFSLLKSAVDLDTSLKGTRAMCYAKSSTACPRSNFSFQLAIWQTLSASMVPWWGTNYLQ